MNKQIFNCPRPGVKRTINPSVQKTFIDEFKKPDGHIVTTRSPRWKHKEMYDRAVSFKRELRYWGVMWDSVRDMDYQAIGYLIRDLSGQFDPNLILGACSFRLRHYIDIQQNIHTLQWIWICPKARHLGILQQHWNEFEKLCPEFTIEGPVSDEMHSYLTKYDPTRRIA